MGRIRRLSEEVIRKIAAGEVVDRPASALKELVENSIDAGARKIRVELERGGIARLLVSDDGHGMTPEEMALAVERHTTSKIATEEDLRHIKTLGFRGEALAAICAVARVRLVSRTPDAPAAHELRVEGGRIVEEKPAAHPVGTTVEVRDLFFNVPARRKFLATPAAEARRSLELLRHLALAHFDRGFLVFSEGRRVLEVAPVGAPLPRLGQIYGESLARRLIPVELVEPGYHLRAFFSPPELAQASRADQHLFLNRRPVRLGHLAVPIYQVYSRFLGRGQHPLFFLYLEVDPELVDVNVHPKKEEVRFQNEEAVLDLLRRAALRALGAFSPTWTGAPAPVQTPPPTATPSPAREEELLDLGPSRARPWRILGQVQRTFILVETEEGLEIVDQHVAHERVLFENFRDRGEIPVQRFLIPVPVELPFDQAEALREALPFLRTLGVELEPFGGNAFLVRGWPAALAERQAKLGFLEPLRAVATLWRAGNRELLELWREVACAAAVRAGEELSPAEQEALIAAWKSTKEPARCPHGRPVAVRLTFAEIREKLGR
ncbi:MAG: DNA mismatch repair endonuclease MutL [Candidatus Bipolaricaulota bacterium]|nr:DNA mismatch repair endonuclease MutL [Candidatus Bipolaricaulota bacterium]